MSPRIEIDRAGTRLSVLDFGGSGESVLLLHGLAGHAGEWSGTADWLSDSWHVYALETRGHGRSERRPEDVSPAASVADAAAAIELVGGGRSVVIGQSLGGATAIRLAAAEPDRVRALVVAEAGVSRDGREQIDETIDAISSWPAPFAEVADAARFFGGPGLSAQAWASGLEPSRDGWVPRFDIDVLRRMLVAADAPLETEWAAISCRTCLVRGSEGALPEAEAIAMARARPDVELVTVEGAGHDVHLDGAAGWRAAVERFLGGL